MKHLLVCLLAIFLLVPVVSARDIWVDANCPTNGDGTSSECSDGASGPFNDLHDALHATNRGDTVLIKDGTYITNHIGNWDPGSQRYWDPGFFVHLDQPRNGAITTITNAPGHSPVLAACSTNPLSDCELPTLTARYHDIHVHNLTIIGALRVHGDAIVTYNRLSRGWEEGGNMGALLLMGPSQGSVVQHNHFTDLYITRTNPFTAAFLYTIDAPETTIEYNTFERFHYTGGQGAHIDKRNSEGSVFRYNLVREVRGGAHGYEHDIYGNVFHCSPNGRTGGAFDVGRGPEVMQHNTVIGCVSGFSGTPQAVSGAVYNNIFSAVEQANTFKGYAQNPFVSALHIDYNAYTPGKYYEWIEQWYADSESLADWRQRYGFDENSQEIACSFQNIAQGDYRLVPGSACTTLGRVGGVSSGAVVELGAFGITDCVGHLCGQPTPQPVDGACGSRAGTFTSSWPSDSSYCQQGSASSQPSFPAPGSSVSWNCNGSNGGSVATCSATTDRVGDLTGDGTVGLADLILVAGSINREPGEPGYDARADLNNDGVVNIVDLVIVATNFGN